MKNIYTGKTRLFLGISGAIIVVALILQIAGLGLNMGIDFTGGSLLSYSVGEDYDVADVETILASAGYENSQITKAAPSDASIALQQERAAALAQQEADAQAAEDAAEDAQTEAAAETTADTSAEANPETVEETADEAAAEPTTAGLLNLDKSNIKADGLTDLQIRLNLVDESEGLEAAIDTAVQSVLPEAQKIRYGQLDNATLVRRDIDPDFAGGYVAEFSVGAEFDAQEVQKAVEEALAQDYSVLNLSAIVYDAEAEAQQDAEAEAEAAGETVEATQAPEATDAPVETEETEAAPGAQADAKLDEAADAAEGTDLRIVLTIDDEASRVRGLLEEEMRAKYPDFSFVDIGHVSAIAGRDLMSNAVKALLITFACMLVYIALRFDLFSGLAALFGLVHDVLVMCAFMVFFRSFFQVNSSFIAAVLTIVGYSINNTIIIFDRIRETAKKPGWSQKSRREIVEVSVANTLNRTINTSLTTLIMLVTLYIFGVESIREFAFPLIVGMLAGTYSSVLLSGQVWAIWMDKIQHKKAQAEQGN